MSQKLAGKIAVVTGASKGIGASIALHLAAAGAAVVVNYSSSKEGADKVVTEITSKGGKAIAVKANVAKEDEIKALFAETVKAYGKVDILVNNAGIYAFAPLEEITPELFHRQYDVNVLGLLLTTKEAVKHIPAEGGSVINVSSIVSSLALPGSSVYAGTKASVDLITHVLSVELGPKKIRVNAVNPGLVETEGTHTAGFAKGEFQEHTASVTPLGRTGQPQDIAPAVVYFASDDSAWVTGQTLALTGGYRG